MERDINVDNSAALVYDQYLAPEFEIPAQQVIAGTAITNLNGLTGPNITLSGGTTGLSFTPAGVTITVAGTLVAANGGTGNASYTKGDLLAASAATTLSKLAVGSNNARLAADSGQATGLVWINASTGFTAWTGTPSAATHATYSGTASVGYAQAELQGVMDALKNVTEAYKALSDALLTQKIINA
jgi:hypothetical protein